MMDYNTIEEKFLAAVEVVKNLPKSGPISPTNDMKLKFYSYYKQATEGPCELPKPGFWDIINRAKWDAWNKLENMSKEEAMKRYVDEFVTVMTESVPNDPEAVAEFYTFMGPYVNLVPEDFRAKHPYVNGNSKFLNNNTEEYLENCSTSKGGKSPINFRKGHQSYSHEDSFAPIVNGHNVNGNDSDSDEFSDTLEQVNEIVTEETPSAIFPKMEENPDSSLISSTKGSIVNVRGGGDKKLNSGENNSPAAGSSAARGNRSSRSARGSDNPLQYLPSNNTSGSGGSRRSGGNLNVDIAADANEQLALAVIRLQHIMEQVIVRLDNLETLLTQRQPTNMEVVTRKSSYWSFMGISPKAALLIIAWPIVVQWIIYLIRKSNRRS